MGRSCIRQCIRASWLDDLNCPLCRAYPIVKMHPFIQEDKKTVDVTRILLHSVRGYLSTNHREESMDTFQEWVNSGHFKFDLTNVVLRRSIPLAIKVWGSVDELDLWRWLLTREGGDQTPFPGNWPNQ